LRSLQEIQPDFVEEAKGRRKKVHIGVDQNPSMDPTLSQLNPICKLEADFLFTTIAEPSNQHFQNFFSSWKRTNNNVMIRVKRIYSSLKTF
jgi:hypothetical protein